MKPTIYHGPWDKPTILRSGSKLRKLNFVRVGWSLLRTFTPFEWQPIVSAPAPCHNISISHCNFDLTHGRGLCLKIGSY